MMWPTRLRSNGARAGRRASAARPQVGATRAPVDKTLILNSCGQHQHFTIDFRQTTQPERPYRQRQLLPGVSNFAAVSFRSLHHLARTSQHDGKTFSCGLLQGLLSHKGVRDTSWATNAALTMSCFDSSATALPF